MQFLGRDLGRERDYGGNLANEIDKASQNIINNCTDETREIIGDRLDELEEIKELLLVKETITGDEVRSIVFKNK
jgi:cell division protease FtsH